MDKRLLLNIIAHIIMMTMQLPHAATVAPNIFQKFISISFIYFSCKGKKKLVKRDKNFSIDIAL
jgi:hypothetical protein